MDTGVQDVRLRLFTRLGELFYDADFGSLIHDWILEESTAATRAAFASEILMRVGVAAEKIENSQPRTV